MERNRKQKNIAVFKPLDAVIALAVCAVAVVCIFSLLSGTSESGLKAVLKQNGRVIKEVTLQALDEPLYFTVEGDVPLTVLFESDGAHVADAACKDKICVENGKLTKAGQTAVCLPARVTLALIDAGGAQNEVDAVTG